MRVCGCEQPVPEHNPRKFGACIKCGHKIDPDSLQVHIEKCGRCKHNFDTLAEGHGGVSFVPRGGWMEPSFKQIFLCPSCRDWLRTVLRIAPVGVDPANIPPDYS